MDSTDRELLSLLREPPLVLRRICQKKSDNMQMLPISTAIIGCDSVAQVEECAQFAREFTPLSERQMTELAQKTEPIAKQALFFRMMPR